MKNYLLTICVQFANPIHIHKCLIYELYTNGLVRKCVPVFRYNILKTSLLLKLDKKSLEQDLIIKIQGGAFTLQPKNEKFLKNEFYLHKKTNWLQNMPGMFSLRL